MKKLRFIISMIVILSILLCVNTQVKAADSKKVTISNGIRNGNVVTFIVTLPAGAGFRGDVNGNGLVDVTDVTILNNYVHEIVDKNEINEFNSDFNKDGDVNVADWSELSNAVLLGGYKNISLIGSLATKVGNSYTVSKNSDGTYKVDVNVPNEEGSIGIKVNEDTVVYSDRTWNNEQSESNLFNPVEECAEKNITISDGTKKDNKVTFVLDLPEGVGLRGDADNNGKITNEDAELVENYVVEMIDSTKLNTCNSDANLDKIIREDDVTTIYAMIRENYSPIKLDGTLAEKSTFEFIKDKDGKYSVVVTVPDEEGTIGVTFIKDAAAFGTKKTTNADISSKLFQVSKNTKDEDKGNNPSKDKDDDKTVNPSKTEGLKDDKSQANKELPKTGTELTVFLVILIIAISGIFGYVKYKNIDR